ncbi:MAG: molybdopterin molybdotransferase MoeA [Pseudomonadota bacterium]
MSLERYIDPDRALALVLEHTPPGRSVTVPLADALGLTLAEEIRADRDFPPFDRAMMDGYAVNVRDAGLVVEVVAAASAGTGSPTAVAEGRAVEIMTGAPCPPGTQAVVMREEIRPAARTAAAPSSEDAAAWPPLAAGRKVLLPPAVETDQYVTRRGSECQAGSVALPIGTTVTAIPIGIIAACGRTTVKVLGRPSLAVVVTGDEIVRPGETRRPEQIHDSNGPMLAAAARLVGLTETEISVSWAADSLEALEQTIDSTASTDVLILSGGVSAGRHDLVPQALERCGATIVFHKVAQKPGKPLLFARRGGQVVFGLPGNPVSGHMCFHRYVVPALHRMMGRPPIKRQSHGVLCAPLTISSERALFVPAVAEESTTVRLRPLPHRSSADILAVAPANAYLRLPPGQHDLAAGQTVSFEWSH